MRILASLIVVILVGAGCQEANHSDQAKMYDVQGKILAIAANHKDVKLDHKEIPGFMEAMKMNFAVADPKLLEGLKVGDQVQGKLRVLGSERLSLVELKKQ